MSNPLTSQPHNDFVGGEASKGRIPGADQATSGHQFIAVDLPRGTFIEASLVLQIHPDQKRMPDQKRHANRAEEHLPPSTGRDAPPAGGVAPGTRTAGSGRE